jgi:hypothetical protein
MFAGRAADWISSRRKQDEEAAVPHAGEQHEHEAADLQGDHQDAFKPGHNRSFYGLLLSRDGLRYKLSDVSDEPAITAAVETMVAEAASKVAA